MRSTSRHGFRLAQVSLLTVVALLASSVIAAAPVSALEATGTPGCRVGQTVTSYRVTGGCGPAYYEVQNGNSQYQYELASTGSLPPGISRVGSTSGPGGSNGYFAGSYTAAGRYIWNHNYKENSGERSRQYVFTIWDGPPVFASGAQTTTGTVGVNVPVGSGYALPFSQFPNAFVYSGLPPGMSLHPDSGVLYGTPTQAGTYTVNVSGSNYFGTASGTIEITIGAGAQTISFSNPGAKTMSSTPFALNVTASSGLTPTVVSSSPLICSVDGLNLTMLGIGTCALRASQAGNASYAAATDALVSFSVSKGTQSPLSLTSVTGTYGSSLTLTTSGGSGSGAVSFAVTSSGTAGCSLLSSSSTDLQFTAPGTCTVTASKAADANYNVISSAPTGIVIGKAAQAPLLLTSTSGTFGTDLVLSFTGGTGAGSISYVVTSGGTAGCSLPTATTLRSTSGGSCSVRIDKAGDSNYLVASSSVTTVTFAGRVQLLPVMMTSPGEMTFGSPLTLTASGGSGTGAFGFGVVDPGTANCSILGTLLTTSGDVGSTCIVRATRAADISNLVRESDPQIITVASRAAQPTLSVSIPSVTYAARTVLTSTGGAGSGQVSYLVSSIGSAGCSIDAGELRTTGDVGSTCSIAAYKAASTNYMQASSAEVTVTVTGRATQVIDFSAPSDREYSASPFTAIATADSGLTVSLTSASPAVCSVSGLLVTMRLPGTCLLDADQSGDGNFLAAPRASRSFQVAPAPQSVSWSPTAGALSTTGVLPLSNAVGSDLGSVTYSVIDAGTTNCTIANPTVASVTFDSPGSCTVQAEAAATSTHLAGTSIMMLVISAPPVASTQPGAADSSSGLLVVRIRSLDPISEYGGLAPGSQRVTVNGENISVIIEANSTSTGLDLIGTGWRIEISARASDGTSRALEPGGILAITAGSTIDVRGSGFDDRSQVRIYLMSRSTHLGSLMTDGSGDFTGSVVAPVDATIGPDTLQINGFTRDRLVRSVSLGVRVTSATLAKPTSVGSRIYFGYRSAVLTAKAKRSLMAMIAQVPAGQSASAAVTGALRSTGASAFDKSLASKRAAVVSRFLKTHGMSGKVTSSVRRVEVRDRFRDRRVEITVRLTA